MNKLREKFEKEKVLVFGCEENNGNPCLIHNTMASRSIDKLEQITDDFSVKLLIWMANLKEDSLDKEIDFTQSDEKIATELQQYFKENIYGKV